MNTKYKANWWTTLKRKAVIFLEAKVADAEAKTYAGYTPMMRAAIGGELARVKALVDQGSDVNARDKDGKTPLMWAADNDHLKVVKFLKQHGATN